MSDLLQCDSEGVPRAVQWVYMSESDGAVFWRDCLGRHFNEAVLPRWLRLELTACQDVGRELGISAYRFLWARLESAAHVWWAPFDRCDAA